MKTTYFTMYDATGRITRVVSASTDVVRPPPLRPGEFLLKGRGNGMTQKVIGKGRSRRIVNKTSAEMKALRKANPKLRFDSGEEK